MFSKFLTLFKSHIKNNHLLKDTLNFYLESLISRQMSPFYYIKLVLTFQVLADFLFKVILTIKRFCSKFCIIFICLLKDIFNFDLESLISRQINPFHYKTSLKILKVLTEFLFQQTKCFVHLHIFYSFIKGYF